MNKFTTALSRHVAAGAAERDIPLAWSQTLPKARDRKPLMWLQSGRGFVYLCHDPLPDTRGRVPGGKYDHDETIIGESQNWEDHDPTDNELRTVDRILDEYAISMERDTQLSALGYSRDHPPAWSLCCQAAAERLHGREKIRAALADPTKHTRSRGFRVEVNIREENANFEYYEDMVTGFPVLNVPGTPEQLRTGDVSGRTVSEILDGDILQNPGIEAVRDLRVRSAQVTPPSPWGELTGNTGPTLDIGLENNMVLLGDPPLDVIPAWLPQPDNGMYDLMGWSGNRKPGQEDEVEKSLEEVRKKQEQADRAGQLVVQLIRDMLNKTNLPFDVGMDVRASPESIRVKAAITGNRPSVTVYRPRHECESHEANETTASLPTGNTLERNACDLASRAVLPMLRLIMRDRQLMDAGIAIKDRKRDWEDDDPRLHSLYPSWAYAIDPIVLAVLLSQGNTPDDIVRKSFRSTYRRMRRDNLRTHEELEKGENDFAGHLYGVKVGLYSIDIAKGVTYHQDRNRIDFDDELPGSVMISLRNGKLTDIIDTSRIQVGEIGIARVTKYRVHLRPVPLVTVSPVPSELGPSWLQHLGAEVKSEMP